MNIEMKQFFPVCVYSMFLNWFLSFGKIDLNICRNFAEKLSVNTFFENLEVLELITVEVMSYEILMKINSYRYYFCESLESLALEINFLIILINMKKIWLWFFVPIRVRLLFRLYNNYFIEILRFRFRNLNQFIVLNSRLDQILELQKLFVACKRRAERNASQKNTQLNSELFVSVVYRLKH